MGTDIPKTYILQPGPIGRDYRLTQVIPVQVREDRRASLRLVLMSYQFNCGAPPIEVSGEDIDSAELELRRVLAERYRTLTELEKAQLPRKPTKEETNMLLELSDFVRGTKPELSGIL